MADVEGSGRAFASSVGRDVAKDRAASVAYCCPVGVAIAESAAGTLLCFVDGSEDSLDDARPEPGPEEEEEGGELPDSMLA